MNREDVESLVKTTLGQIEKVLGSKTVIGESIKVGETTLIPLLSVGFGFGGAAGAGNKKPEASGGAGAAAGGIKPIAIIVIDQSGARIEAIKGGMASALERLGENMPDAISKIADRWGGEKKGE